MILPEYALTDPLSCAHLSSLDKYRLQVSSKNMSAAAKKRHTYLTCWPMFVFNQYDLGDIVEKIRKYFRQLNIGKNLLSW